MEEFLQFLGSHYLLTGAWVAVFTLLMISLVKTATSGSKSLTPQQLTHMVNREGASIVDVRAIADYNKGHIIGAINMPLTKLKDNLKEMEKYQANPIIIVCANGLQAGTAVMQLRKAGFNSVHKLNGGVQAWQAENLPLSS